ncbi:RNA-directed DNA polymerase, eukaryota, reverse transcriptase zinc-binding domain protein [Tanacetum coccineum]
MEASFSGKKAVKAPGWVPEFVDDSDDEIDSVVEIPVTDGDTPVNTVRENLDMNKEKDDSDTREYPPGFTPKEIGKEQDHVNVSSTTPKEDLQGEDFTHNSQCNMKSNSVNSSCSGHFKVSTVPKTGGSILNCMEELVKVGQTMGYAMEGVENDIMKIIEQQGEEALKFLKNKIKEWNSHFLKNSKADLTRLQEELKQIDAEIDCVKRYKRRRSNGPFTHSDGIRVPIDMEFPNSISSSQQVEFRGRSAVVSRETIMDGPFILNEVMQWCSLKKMKTLIFKVDFEKAYDSSCLSSSRGSILINGSPTSEFQFFRGLKQDVFHRASGLKLIEAISKILGLQVESSKVREAAEKLGCLILRTPFTYLGTKVGDNMNRVLAWQEVIDKVKNRLSNWKMKALSIGGNRGSLGVASFPCALNRGLILKWLWKSFVEKDSIMDKVIKAIHEMTGSRQREAYILNLLTCPTCEATYLTHLCKPINITYFNKLINPHDLQDVDRCIVVAAMACDWYCSYVCKSEPPVYFFLMNIYCLVEMVGNDDLLLYVLLEHDRLKRPVSWRGSTLILVFAAMAGDDDNVLFSTLSLPRPITWLGNHTECVIAALSGVWWWSGKQSRSQKKSRKAMLKLGMKVVLGVSRVTIKRTKNVSSCCILSLPKELQVPSGSVSLLQWVGSFVGNMIALSLRPRISSNNSIPQAGLTGVADSIAVNNSATCYTSPVGRQRATAGFAPVISSNLVDVIKDRVMKGRLIVRLTQLRRKCRWRSTIRPETLIGLTFRAQAIFNCLQAIMVCFAICFDTNV